MRKILRYRWCVFFIVFMGILSVVAQDVPPPGPGLPGGVPPPEGITCCKDLEANPGDPGYAEYEACLANPEPYCPIPIDNSVYILMGAGFVLASYVIFRKIRHTKTPM